MGDRPEADDRDDSTYGSFLRELARTTHTGEPAPPELTAGTLLAERFEVIREIGRGGFARVYQARDRVLSRSVAIKLVARRGRLSDRALELFFREAQATARLNHALIVTAHDWGQWNGMPFLVLELLEGETLAALVRRGPLAEQRAWTIAAEVTRAVAYAHAQGVLHLDLKTQNVFVLADDRVKVLDFGLAGLEWEEAEVARVEGGTPATMAPEQEDGRPTDARTDIWAIGMIIHEMLSGHLPPRLAPGAATVDVPPGFSRAASEILRRTLARDPAERFPDAPALLAALELATPVARPRRIAPAWIAGGAIAIAVTAAVAVWATRDREAPAAQVLARPTAPGRHRQLTFTGDVFQAELSPRGDAFAYVSADKRELWAQKIDSDQPQRLFAGEGLHDPRWIGDGRELVVGSAAPANVLWQIPAGGGAARRLPQSGELGVAIDDQTLAVINRVQPERPTATISNASSGGDVRTIALPPNAKHVFDFDAATDARLLMTIFDREGQIWSVRAGTAPELLHSEPEYVGSARWQGRGQGVFFVRSLGSDGAVMWIPVPRRGAPATTVFDGVSLGQWLSPSRDGRRLLYHRRVELVHLVRVQLSGSLAPLIEGTAGLSLGSVARDGRSLVYALHENTQSSIVVTTLDRDSPRTRVVRCPRLCASPTWSPDAARIALTRDEPHGTRIVVVGRDGSGEKVFDQTRPNGSSLMLDWLSNREVLYTPTNSEPLRVVDIETGADRPFFVEPTPGWMYNGRVSPDGRRVAYFWTRGKGDRGVFVADRSGRNARAIADGRRVPIAWSADNTKVIVTAISGDNDMWRTESVDEVDVATSVVTTLWRPPEALVVQDLVGIPGTRDYLGARVDARSDAWLLEDPLGK